MADRVDRRNVLVGAQLFAAGLAVLVATLVVLDLQTLPIVASASLSLGLVIAIEVPVRQAYMTELVPVRDVSSAASLHATAWNSTRLVGPLVAGIMIATIGAASPFVFAGLASLVVVLSFLWMDRYREHGRQRVDRSHSILADLRGGAAFALGEPVVLWCLLLILAAGMFGMSTFSTLAPIYARDELGVGAEGYGAFLGAAGAGALTAALLVTTFAHGDRRPWLIVGALAMAGLVGGIALAGSAAVVFVLAFLLGAAQIDPCPERAGVGPLGDPGRPARAGDGPVGHGLPGFRPLRLTPLRRACRRARRQASHARQRAGAGRGRTRGLRRHPTSQLAVGAGRSRLTRQDYRGRLRSSVTRRSTVQRST